MPNESELKAYTRLLSSMRDLPSPLKQALECIPSDAHPMVCLFKFYITIIEINSLFLGCCSLRSIYSWGIIWHLLWRDWKCDINFSLQTLEPESEKNNQFHVANRLVASFGSMLLYWHHWVTSKKRINTTSKPVRLILLLYSLYLLLLCLHAIKEDSTAVHFLKLLHDSKDEVSCCLSFKFKNNMLIVYFSQIHFTRKCWTSLWFFTQVIKLYDFNIEKE